MIRLSARVALNRTDDIYIPAPDCVAKFRDTVASLRAKAVEAKAAMTMEVAAEPQSAPEKGGGMFGKLGAATSGALGGGKLGSVTSGVLGAAGDLADKAADKVGDVAEAGAVLASGAAGDAVAATLNGLADMLEKSIDEFEKPFTTVGKEITGPKKQELLEVYYKYIETIDVLDPTAVVRGIATETVVKGKPAKRWGPEEYAAVRPSGLSEYFNKISKQELEKQLLPVVAEGIEQHTITKQTQNLVDNYNKVGESAVLAKVGLNFDNMEFKVGPHIVSHTILCLGGFIAETEAKYRKNSEEKSDRMPKTFAKIYSGQELFLVDYIYFNEGMVRPDDK